MRPPPSTSSRHGVVLSREKQKRTSSCKITRPPKLAVRPSSPSSARREELADCALADTAAARLAEDNATRTRFASSAAAAAISLAEQGVSIIGEAEAAVTFAERYDEYVKAGGDPEKDELVSAATAVYAWTVAAKAFEELDDKLCVHLSPL